MSPSWPAVMACRRKTCRRHRSTPSSPIWIRSSRRTTSRWASSTTLLTIPWPTYLSRSTRKGPSAASSGALVRTVRLAPTRTPSRLSATTRICMSRLTLNTIPRNPAASPSRTCALARSRSGPPIISNRRTSWPAINRPTWALTILSVKSRMAASSCSTAAGIKTTSPTTSAIK